MTRNDLIKKINNSTPLEKRLIIEMLAEFSNLTLQGETLHDILKYFGIKNNNTGGII